MLFKEYTNNVIQSNKKKNKNPGEFQAMGLSFPVLKGITKRGFKQPTPIQRKTIPLALSDKHLVAMARTGSGKTACCVLPILEKLEKVAKGNWDDNQAVAALTLALSGDAVQILENISSDCNTLACLLEALES